MELMSDHVMTAESAIRLLDALTAQGVEPCVGGGWAVDALLGRQTREHSDLDLWVAAPDAEPLFLAFAQSEWTAKVEPVFTGPTCR